MKFKWVEERINYDGTQLRSLYNYLTHQVLGDSIVSFIGSCNVNPAHMVDGEDLLAGDQICSDEMVHFIIEKFDSTLLAAVSLQRLLSSIAIECLCQLNPSLQGQLFRRGDDIYFNDGKLSISIASQSPISSMIHFAVNVTNNGTPVKTSSLHDLNVEPEAFALAVMKAFTDEVDSIVTATHKVRWLK